VLQLLENNFCSPTGGD